MKILVGAALLAAAGVLIFIGIPILGTGGARCCASKLCWP